MTPKTPAIRTIAIADIAVLNPRARNRRVFQELVTSIQHLGLKKPITVAERADGGYDLVCGQGRLEAFVALGQTHTLRGWLPEARRHEAFALHAL